MNSALGPIRPLVTAQAAPHDRYIEGLAIPRTKLGEVEVQPPFLGVVTQGASVATTCEMIESYNVGVEKSRATVQMVHGGPYVKYFDVTCYLKRQAAEAPAYRLQQAASNCHELEGRTEGNTSFRM